MSDSLWFLLVGGLMLARGLTVTLLQRSPITPAMFYLALGLLLGPTILNLFHFNPLQESALLEVLTEVVVLISLFSAGVKMPAPIDVRRWRAPVMLASVSMAISVGMVAAFAYYVLELPLGVGVLLGAILAPTDPVLATDVQTRHPGDKDPLRFTLTCEAGMNDGSAFPFVMLGLGLLGLQDLGEFNLHWVLIDVLWSTVAGVVIGLVSGYALAHMARSLRGALPDQNLMDNFLGLGLIGVVYGLSLLIDAWGFLAVFFAAVSLRQTEFKLALSRQEPERAYVDSIPMQSQSARPGG
ncbi:cation:proton antiporter [Aliiglaciecola sp. CAU 1673]|uniref:cation:proton antiporter domain-containing protein n=1 Tax=Aliiglaciecola sp. CAU 1673 TaxID=3032595 RepID=UPI0023D9BB24|nr:cation:proton antiporter [Aliiglaciecola sp. CAU 1673]MDF2178949.1 cation:proton antiporter [Aliiglaciecola sp. CAU 1673]